MGRIYLDWAAAAPVSGAAKRAFLKALSAYGNPSSAHEEGRAAKAILEGARADIARAAGAKAEHVVFTGSATEANALALEGYVRARLSEGARPEDVHVLYLPGAHASITETVEALSAIGVKTEALPLKEGNIDLVRLSKMLRPETALVSLEAVSSETGARFDTRGVRRALDEALPTGNSRIALHVDASQLPLVESFERTRLGADLLTLDAQKVGGVRGIGCLIQAAGITLAPVIRGGGQERGLRSGTPAPALAAAFAVALTEAAGKREAFAARAREARVQLIKRLTTALPYMVVNEGTRNTPHILNISLPGRDTDYLQALLNEHGFAVSTRSACESDSEEGSRAVRALSVDAERARVTLRVSWGPDTSQRALERFAAALIKDIRFLDETAI